jgi:FixJ family two-component response regulator
MNLTEKERLILQLAQQGLSDYRIARKINSDPPSITRSRKNAQKKLVESALDLEWALRLGVKIENNSDITYSSNKPYAFFL